MALPTRLDRADQYGTDVEIWYEHGVFADVRTGAPDAAHRILWEYGFTLDPTWLGPDCRVLARDDGGSEDKACATWAAQALARAGFTANLDPMLLSRTPWPQTTPVTFAGSAPRPAPRRPPALALRRLRSHRSPAAVRLDHRPP